MIFANIELYVLLPSILALLIFGIRMIYLEVISVHKYSIDFSSKIDSTGISRKILLNSKNKKNNKLNDELIALLQVAIVLISAGETPINSLKLAADRAEGFIAEALQRAFSKNLNSTEIVRILKILAKDSKNSSLNRMALSIQNALDRGTPIIEVLQNQIRSMQSKNQAELMKIAGRRELILLMPVVFLLMPISIAFVVWSSLYQLQSFGF